jgi:hypothetical protein
MSGRLTFIYVLEANLGLSCVSSGQRLPLRLFISKWIARWSAFLVKPDGVWAMFQRLILMGERSGLLTLIVAMESVSLRADEKLTAFIELKFAIRACDELA